MGSETMETPAAPAAQTTGRGRSRRIGIALAGAALVVLTVGGSVMLAASPTSGPDGGTNAVRPDAVPDPAAADAAFKKFAACMRDHGIDMPDPVMIEADADAGAVTSTGTTSAGAASAGTIVVSGSAGAAIPIDAKALDAGAAAIPIDAKAFDAANAACAPILEAAGLLTGSGTSITVSGGAAMPVPAGGLPVTGGAVVGVGVIGGGDVTAQAEDMKTWAACMRSHGVDVPDPEVDTKAGTVQITFDTDPGSDAFRAANSACATGTFDFALPAAPAPAPVR
jgi:hypothetical protein